MQARRHVCHAAPHARHKPTQQTDIPSSKHIKQRRLPARTVSPRTSRLISIHSSYRNQKRHWRFVCHVYCVGCVVGPTNRSTSLRWTVLSRLHSGMMRFARYVQDSTQNENVRLGLYVDYLASRPVTMRWWGGGRWSGDRRRG